MTVGQQSLAGGSSLGWGECVVFEFSGEPLVAVILEIGQVCRIIIAENQGVKSCEALS